MARSCRLARADRGPLLGWPRKSSLSLVVHLPQETVSMPAFMYSALRRLAISSPPCAVDLSAT
jgi:hypothetical protein